MNPYHGIEPKFDDPNLVSGSGLVPLMELANSAGLTELLDGYVTLPEPGIPAKVTTMVAAIAVGADSFDDLDELSSGGINKVLTDVRASSTIGTFSRSVTNGGQIDQFGKVGRLLLSNLAHHVPDLIDSRNDLVFLADCSAPAACLEPHSTAKHE